jgi:hypothetical protein
MKFEKLKQNSPNRNSQRFGPIKKLKIVPCELIENK